MSFHSGHASGQSNKPNLCNKPSPPLALLLARLTYSAMRAGCEFPSTEIQSFDVTRPAANSVESIGLSSAPAGEKKAASNGLVVAVKMPQQRNQFIPLDENPRWIVDDQLGQGFVACIVRAVAHRRGRLRLLPQSEIDASAVGVSL